MYKGRVQQRGSSSPHQSDTQKLLELNSKLIRVETTLNFCMTKLEELEKKSSEHNFMEVRLNENADNIKLLSSKLIEFTKAIHSHLINNDKQDNVTMETCNVKNSKVQIIDSKHKYEDNFVNLDKSDQEEKERRKETKEKNKKQRIFLGIGCVIVGIALSNTFGGVLALGGLCYAFYVGNIEE